MKRLFLSWHAPSTRQWYPVGRLSADGRAFEFVYTRGALQARAESGFQPLPAFPELESTYRSAELFPLFANRLLPPSRPEYADFVGWMSVPRDEADPLDVLGRSGGHRATDRFEVFPEPRQDADGYYRLHFFVHGLSHFPITSRSRAATLQPGERLLLMHDFQNEHDPRALMLRTAESAPGDLHMVGFCPRYLTEDVFAARQAAEPPEVTVTRTNPPPAPVQFRLLCQVRYRGADGYRPFSGEPYKPIARTGTSLEEQSLGMKKAG